MQISELDRLVVESTSEVLETMFFTCIVGDADGDPPDPVSTKLDFKGTPSGSFGLSLSKDTSRQIAAGFLAEDEFEISQAQADEVVCELTNMLCGSLLSRMESENCFELTHPELASIPESRSYSRNFALESGSIGIWLNLAETE
jgi:CheY-specific phosphatase CheX